MRRAPWTLIPDHDYLDDGPREASAMQRAIDSVRWQRSGDADGHREIGVCGQGDSGRDRHGLKGPAYLRRGYVIQVVVPPNDQARPRRAPDRLVT
jgi:hypothetical protein